METILRNEQLERSYLHNDIIILPAWIQKRVSTQHQVGLKIQGIFQEKASLEEQSRLCREGIIRYKGNCPTCSKEIRLRLVGESSAKGESGRNFDREDIEEILKTVKEGAFKVLVTTENDRLARKRSVAVNFRDELKQLGIQVYSLSQPLPIKCPTCFDPLDDDVGIITETISDMKSQLDLSRIRRNYKMGMPRRIERGLPTGSLAYGLVKKYAIVGKDVMGNDILKLTYEWDKSKTYIVERIAREYLSGKGTWKMCRDLNSEGITSPKGFLWGRSAIIHIIKNPIYAGLIRYGWKPVKNGTRKIQNRDRWMIRKAEFKGIWSVEYYEKIQEEIKRKLKIGGRAAASTGLLIGLLKCGRCGGSMFKIKSWKTLKNGNKYLYEGYGCGYFMQKGTCIHVSVKQEVVDKAILQEVIKLANDETRKSFYNKLNNTKQQTLKKIILQKETQLKKLNLSYGRVLQAFRNGVDSLEEYARNKESLLPNIKQTEKELIQLRLKSQSRVNLTWTKHYTNAVGKFLEYPTAEYKSTVKAILNKLIERIELTKISRKERKIKIFYRIDTPDVFNKELN